MEKRLLFKKVFIDEIPELHLKHTVFYFTICQSHKSGQERQASSSVGSWGYSDSSLKIYI